MSRLPGAANGPRGAEQICLLGAIGASGAIRVLSRASIPRNPSQAVASCQMIALAPSNYIPPFSSFSSTVPLFLLPFHIIPPSFLLNMTDSPGRDQLLPRRLEAQKSVLAPRLPSAPLLHLPKRGQENVASSIPLCQRGCIRTGWQARVGLIKTEAGGPNIGTAASLPGRTGKAKQTRWTGKQAKKIQTSKQASKQANKQTNKQVGPTKQNKQPEIVTGPYQFPTW